ncbi:hypothetical protein M595_0232 [Lyngbya aestuarii BL J]|uniref:Uncharacterized protein n=1 Tax=Lyngbya aestuarii BL J TaxID=1348334 RepID=U7QPY4_9CYAN|nr:hypothetical protein [Lyngbya aestuarii]ERT09913.1 hypothetical protein M595_0232 [Lyngbya aestuarii BL J]
MSASVIHTETQLAQASPADPSATQSPSITPEMIWMGASGILLLILIVFSILFKLKTQDLDKQLRMEQFRNKELQKKYKLAVGTISKMEKNPDLIHSREFNLDYLRMRMAEDVFHYAIIVQIKMKVKQKIALALRPTQAAVGEKSNAGTGRQVDSTFDVEYETGQGNVSKKRILFRIQIRLMKLPTQATSTTINQIIDCLETYLSPSDDRENWQPTIQGRIVQIQWDQKAKPTPLLVLEQSNDGMNVTFKTTRQTPGSGIQKAVVPGGNPTAKKRKKSTKISKTPSTTDKS